jgi:signal transduction histidine kinase
MNGGANLSRSPLANVWTHPARVWLLVLVLIFVAEYTVMLVLPWLLPADLSWFSESVVDSILLTVVVAPALWWTVVRPLQQVLRIRTWYLTQLFSNIEAERRRMAYELHDGIGQSLTMLVSGLRTLRACPDRPDLPERLRSLEQVAEVALKDIRQLALGLRPSLLDDLGLAPAIEQVAAEVQENHYPLELTVDVGRVAGKRLPDIVETAVFRIFQEALNNTVKHSAARRASVQIQTKGAAIVLRMSDDGRGFDAGSLDVPAAGVGHLGLLGMRERAHLLGGKLVVESQPGRGTTLTFAIPGKERVA